MISYSAIINRFRIFLREKTVIYRFYNSTLLFQMNAIIRWEWNLVKYWIRILHLAPLTIMELERIGAGK